MLDRLDDTIVAVSSAPGYGAVGIVRLSGKAAYAIADRTVSTNTSRPLAACKSATRISGEVRIDDTLALPAVFYLFRAPRTYTRQDLVEIHTIGAPAALELVRRRLIDLGAVPAQPGEFTARAFLNGAMDLSSAEGVAALIRAETDAQLRASRRMIDGSLATRIKEIRNDLAQLLALVEADIDFSEEPIEFITGPVLRTRLAHLADHVANLTAKTTCLELFDTVPRILLLGAPNVGKSSLMNRLSGTSRAICAATAGTTRDILSAPIRLDRGEAVLLDAAGIDDAQDEIIALARGLTLSTAANADLLCIVLDLSNPDDDHALELIRSFDRPRLVVAANKCDLVDKSAAADVTRRLVSRGLTPVCAVSALHGTGLEGLRTALTDALGSRAATTHSESVLLSERQLNAVRGASEALLRAQALATDLLETLDCAETLAFELREALDFLGAVTGEVTTDDLLGEVFANFCIGK